MTKHNSFNNNAAEKHLGHLQKSDYFLRFDVYFYQIIAILK